MSWFLFALICLLSWGCADLFYKRGTDESDRYSHLKIAVWVGIMMGVSSLALLIFAGNGMTAGDLLENAVKYLPASLGYIISMVIGYAGIRYLEMSIISPVQNASGALTAVALIAYYVITGNAAGLADEFGMPALDITGTVLIVAGIIALAFAEKRLADRENAALAAAGLSDEEKKKQRRYRIGALALIFPLLYCLFDTIGTAADGIILDEETGLGIGEIEVLILYGFTFFLAGLGCWIWMLIREKKPYNPFGKGEMSKEIAAGFEEFGQVFYVYAMAQKPVLAAPMIAGYCIVSLLLCRVFQKEKLTKAQYACVFIVIAGILLLGISEGIGEA
ncbi:MAG: hypothetical protein CW338_07700 [Clostridiales bacterium]|nr:hypothetical protein [Clostridiales bacterium]